MVNLGEDFKADLENLNQEIMLEPVELEILSTLEEEARQMRAGEIAALIDVTHQLVGKRTTKLRDAGLVQKALVDGHMKSQITPRAKDLYFVSWLQSTEAGTAALGNQED